MEAFPAIRSFELSSLSGPAFFIPRPQLTSSNKLFFFRAKSVAADSSNAGSHNFGVASANLLVAEKENTKAVLTLFLKKRGFSKVVAARTVNKSALFIDHLVSRLHSVHKTRHLLGLTSLEIRDALNPYLETLYEEFGDILVDAVENFPNPPIEERSTENLSIPSVEEGPVVPVPAPATTLKSKKLKSLARLTDYGSTGKPPPHIIYLTELGMELEVIKEVTRKFPTFASYSVDGNIKPLVEFLLDLGVPKSNIPSILRKRPELCRFSLSEDLIPTVRFLESLGMDKKRWPWVIYRFPWLLCYSMRKLKSNLDCLYELGLSTEKQGKVIMRCPSILGCGVEKLRARAEYFKSMGVDVGTLLHQCPQIFGLSIEANLKPVTEFFLERHRGGCSYGFKIWKFLHLKLVEQHYSQVGVLFDDGLLQI